MMMYSHDIIKKRVFITGANGMLGQRLVEAFSQVDNIELLTCSMEPKPFFDNVDYICCDITKRENVKKVIFEFYPDYVINTAAFTNVDLSELERETAWKVNVKGVEYLADSCRVLDAHLIHISSDYIFDGTKGPYSERDKPKPLGYYGRTKLASENALKISGAIHTILRTNVLYGMARNSRPDFVRWVISQLRSKREIRIVTDQFNNPTFTDDMVQAITKVMEFRRQGIYNIGGRDFLSRYDFSLQIAEYFGLDTSLIKPIITEELNQTAKRPLRSGLITLKAETELSYKPRSIRETLKLMKKYLNI
jgi:dTDP-4-dehydrorhamnose reductase